MSALKQKIIEKIQRTGPISFKNFMEMALYAPDLGYYTSQKTKIGRAGDFFTSSHLHPIYGAMIGRQIEEMWEIMKRPSDFHVIEMGAGVGYLCKDMLDYLKGKKMFDSLTYIIVELNPVMRERQKDLLSEYINKVRWSLSLKELQDIRGRCDSIPSCILSNELLDSFPVHLIEMEDEIREVFIDVKGEELIEIRRKPCGEIADYLKEFSINITKGYRTEINIYIKEWLKQINDVLKEGFIFTIDYGYSASDYYSEDRNRGTLLCYYKHQVIEDPYQNIGEQDITAHVNFSSVKKWGEEEGLKTIGFCAQGIFLISLGIDEMIQERYKDSPDYLFEVAKIKRLLFPGTMGETHKVMIQYKGDGYPELRGFSMKNQKEKL